MKPITLDELWDLTSYELQREAYRAGIIALKRHRRVAVGPRVTFIFENRDTVRFQVQEMLRTERTVKPEDIQAELDVYNELLPRAGELSATLMIEITDLGEIRPVLDQLIGLDEHVILRVGDFEVRASFDPKQFEEDRISAVQYVRFPLGDAVAAAFSDPATPASLALEHPNYTHTTPLEGDTRASLIEDLRY